MSDDDLDDFDEDEASDPENSFVNPDCDELDDDMLDWDDPDLCYECGGGLDENGDCPECDL